MIGVLPMDYDRDTSCCWVPPYDFTHPVGIPLSVCTPFDDQACVWFGSCGE